MDNQNKVVASELTWLYTHCHAIGMDCKSDSGKWEHDIALFTINQKARIEELERAAIAMHQAAARDEQQPKLVLALPDYDKRQIIIASDEVIDGERIVCVGIKDLAAAEPVPTSEAVHQWRRKVDRAPWHDGSLAEAYLRVDDQYEARTLYTIATKPAASEALYQERIECMHCGSGFRHTLNCPDGVKGSASALPDRMPPKDNTDYVTGWNDCIAACKFNVRDFYSRGREEAIGDMREAAAPVPASEAPFIPAGYANEADFLRSQLASAKTCIKAHEAVLAERDATIAQHEAQMLRMATCASEAVDVPYDVALTAIETLRGNAATCIEDHAKDTYPGALGMRPQDVANMWAAEVHAIDAKTFLDEAIADAAPAAPTKDTK